MLIVQKFGGSSVADSHRVMNVAKHIVDTYKKGNKVVVVLSAQGDLTDDLIAKAQEINPSPSNREMDMLLSTGEQQSVALMAMAIHKLGCAAISFNAMQTGIYTSSNYGNARIKKIEAERLKRELDKNNIVLVAGFQGYNRFGDITTLGRGGSDTTAVALAAVLRADLCEIYTDVDGIYTADPRVVKNAIKMDEISYDEMLELATLGATVLHNRSVEMAKKYGVNLVVRSSITLSKGTFVKEEVKVEKMFVRGVAVDREVARISIVGLKDQPGVAYKIFSVLAKNKISIDIILQSIGRLNTKDITFTVHKQNLSEALRLLEEQKSNILYDHVSYDDNIAKLSIVGAGMESNPGVASDMFEALYDGGINIQMISTSEIKISVLIEKKDVELGANLVHDKFMRDEFERFPGRM